MRSVAWYLQIEHSNAPLPFGYGDGSPLERPKILEILGSQIRFAGTPCVNRGVGGRVRCCHWIDATEQKGVYPELFVIVGPNNVNFISSDNVKRAFGTPFADSSPEYAVDQSCCLQYSSTNSFYMEIRRRAQEVNILVDEARCKALAKLASLPWRCRSSSLPIANAIPPKS